jgi:predicted ATP-grasp superfamily ATP-dependent carboligase
MAEAAALFGETGGVPAGLAVEGRAMLGALLHDGLRADDLELTLLLDDAVDVPLTPGIGHGRVTVIRVPDGEERHCLAEAAAAADWTVVVAPETNGILADRVALARAAGGRVAGADGPLITLAADKQATALALAAAGVAVPAGVLLPAGARLPGAFRRPAVAKALDRCGGDGLVVLPRGADLPPAPLPRRVEAFVAGTPVGVSCLCGPTETIVLPPVRQRFSTGIHPGFLGGDLRLESLPRNRAMALARRAIRGLESPSRRARGWVGVDMILGDREDGVDDRVLEINPRMTTSFVGLSTLGTASLLRAMLAVVAGRPFIWPGMETGRDGVFTVDGGPVGRGDVEHGGSDGLPAR